jgi:hypothetical protein
VRDLVRNALRMRPDRIIVGEVRGGDALDMLQATNTGHEGVDGARQIAVSAYLSQDSTNSSRNQVGESAPTTELPIDDPDANVLPRLAMTGDDHPEPPRRVVVHVLL